MGDVSARTALTLHRGTKHASRKAGPCWSSAWTAPTAPTSSATTWPSPTTTGRRCPAVRRHLACPVVDELKPIDQKHTIDGLVMGEA
jgi:hypothetical protein